LLLITGSFEENIVLLYLENVPLATGQIWIQNDEALPRFGRETMDTRTRIN
jgi:hypothetical protein